jgi:hypothetical protein
MTKRLEEAIARLTPEQLDLLVQYAESLPSLVESPGVASPAPAEMKWAGCLKDGPWKTGLEAQEAANKLRIELLLRGMPK